MPCDIDSPTNNRRTEGQNLQNQIEFYQNEKSRLTALVCSVCRILIEYDFDLKKVDKNLSTWWNQHKRKDKKEAEKESRKEQQWDDAVRISQKLQNDPNSITNEDYKFLKKMNVI